MIDRGSIQGDIYSPPSFTIALDRIFRRHDIYCEGVGGPPLNIPRVSKLEYADDAALANKRTIESSARILAVASGGSAEARLDISLKKTKAMPIRKNDPVSETLEEEIIKLNLPNKCPACNRTFPTIKSHNKH